MALQLRFTKINRLVQKLVLFVAKGPVYYYIYGSWRLRRLVHTKLNRWNTFQSAIIGTPAAQIESIRKWDRAVQLNANSFSQGEECSRLANFRANIGKRFGYDIERRLEVIAHVQRSNPTTIESTIAAANLICQYKFRFRQISMQFDGTVDWFHQPNGNQDWTWDLNRHTYFELLGRAYWYSNDEKFADTYCKLISDWLQHNPPGVQEVNWSSVFEVALRINTWLAALRYFAHSPTLNEELFVAIVNGLWQHGKFLDAYIELHARNNHVLLEAKALAMLGILVPELSLSERWLRRGLTLFYQELREQVCDDGVHGERATHYHRAISGELFELLVVLENNGIGIPDDVRDILGRMVEYELWITRPDGHISLIGDSARHDVHLRFSAIRGASVFLNDDTPDSTAQPPSEAEIWLLGPDRLTQPAIGGSRRVGQLSRGFPSGGYFVMRDGWTPEAHYLAFDCGPFGYRHDQTHGHADALSFELYANGQTWLVDPGIYSTHLGWEWRRFFRGTRSHNTVLVDEEDQSRLLDSRRVYRPAHSTLHHWVSHSEFDFVDGSHDGYGRLSPPIRHRRQIFWLKSSYWVVIDYLLGQGEHTYDLLFHAVPNLGSALINQSGHLWSRDEDFNELYIVPALSDGDALQADILVGEDDPVQGWVSTFSGQKEPAPVLRYRKQGGAPYCFATVLFPSSPNENLIPRVTLLDRECSDHHIHIAISVETDMYVDTVISQGAESCMSIDVNNVQTDARVTFVRKRRETPTKTNRPELAILVGSDELLLDGNKVLENLHAVA